MKKKAILVFLLLPLLSFGQWEQIGTDIDGLAAGEGSGSSIQLNNDGSTAAIASPRAQTEAINGGKIRIFDRDGSNWVQRGGDIDGFSEGDIFGTEVALSGNGNVVIGGAPAFLNPDYLTPNGSPGYANVFEWSGASWEQRGDILFGDAPNDLAGQDVAINNDGSIIAVSSFSHTQDNGVSEGLVRIYEWNGENYIQLGEDILGQAVEGFGTSVALNEVGTIVAIGVIGDDTVVNSGGSVRVFEWNGTDWIQKGADIQGGVESTDRFGQSVSLDESGNTVSAGAIGQIVTGFVKVFEWDGTNWVQKGANLDGDQGSDFFGLSSQLSNDGNTLIAGGFGNDNGYAKVFRFTDGAWVQGGEDILGEAENDQFGRSTSISGDGTIVASGTPFNDGNGMGSGHVRVFNNSSLSIAENTLVKINAYPNPTRDLLFVSAQSPITEIAVYNLLGQKVAFLNNQSLTATIDVSTLANGHYVAQIKTVSSTRPLIFIKN